VLEGLTKKALRVERLFLLCFLIGRAGIAAVPFLSALLAGRRCSPGRRCRASEECR
jgi:hypothetical protein